jgi:hypothetical protein
MTGFEYGRRFEGFDPSNNQEKIKIVTVVIDGRRVAIPEEQILRAFAPKKKKEESWIPEKASTEEFWKK